MLEYLVENRGLVGLALVAVAAVALAAWYFWCQSRKSRHEHHVEKTIQALGVDYLKDVVLPDGIDGLAFFDYLLLVPKGLVVLDVLHQEGLLFGGASVDQWTQVIRGKTYKFNNPLYLHQNHRQAVQWNSNDVAVFGRVVFSNAGRFPKGIPEGVSMIDALGSDLAALLGNGPIPDGHRAVWQQLHDTSLTTRAQLSRGIAQA